MIKQIVRYSVSFLLYYSGIIFLLRLAQRKQGTLKILMYHRVNDDLESSAPTLPVKRFRKHMEYLKKHYAVVSLSEEASLSKARGTFTSNAVSVTFDDGHKDTVHNVLPIIKELHIPVTVFITSGCMKDTGILWTEKVYFYFKEHHMLRDFPGFRENLKKVDDKERIEMIKQFASVERQGLMLTWDDVGELGREQYAQIGAHTQTHPVLTKTSMETAHAEINGCKLEIEKKIGNRVKGFSYPFGKYNEAIKKLVQESGFDYACSVDGGFNTKKADLYSLRRVNIDNCPVFVFAAELCGVIGRLRRILKN